MKKMTFDLAFELATAMETAEKNTFDIQTKQGRELAETKMAENVNIVEKKNESPTVSKQIECWFCNKKGHIQQDCHFKKKLEKKQNMKGEKYRSRKDPVKKVEQSSDKEPTYAVFNFGKQGREKPFVVQVDLNGHST